MITLHLPVDLAAQFQVHPVVSLTATTCAEALQALDLQFPGIAGWLAESDGRFRENLGVFISGRRLPPRANIAEPLAAGDEVWILRAISGG